jgi:hypothetical protein
VYTCGGRQVRYVDLLLASPFPANTASNLLTTLPNLPGNDESARDIRLLAPVYPDPLQSVAHLDMIHGVQGGMIVAYGTNLQRLNRYGVPVGSFDVGSGRTALNAWRNVAVDPTDGSFLGTDQNTANLYRFPLPSGATQSFNTSMTQTAALAVNGEPRLAQAMRLLDVSALAPVAATTFLAGTPWQHTFGLEAAEDDPDLPMRVSVTSYEVRSGGPFADLDVSPRFDPVFPNTTAVGYSRGRASYYRVIRQLTTADPSTIEPPSIIISIDYLMPVDVEGTTLTGLYTDPYPHSERGFVADDKFLTNIRSAWYKTREFITSTPWKQNDFIVATQTAPAATFTPKTEANLGSSLPLRPTYPAVVGGVTDAFCAALVLTVGQTDSNRVIGDSSNLLNLGVGIPFFSPVGADTCGGNLDLTPGIFQENETYNVCVIKQVLTEPTVAPDLCASVLIE